MPTSRLYAARRKPGPDEGAYRHPEPGSKDDTPLGRRRHLLGWLRSRPDLPSVLVRVLEAQLDRVSIRSANLIIWDSIEGLATRAGVSQRSVIAAQSAARDRGLQLRLGPAHLEAWLDAVGRELGFDYPEGARRPSRFTVMLFHLPPEAAERARVCARRLAPQPAKSARQTCVDCLKDLPVPARRPPISGIGPVELDQLNRKADEELDSGSKLPEKVAPDSQSPIDWSTLQADFAGVFRPRRVETRPSPPPPPPPPPPPVVVPDPPPRAEAPPQVVVPPPAPSPDPTPEAQPGNGRVSGLVRQLPGGGRHLVERVTRALLRHFREAGNPITRRTFAKYLEKVRVGALPADLVVGLVDDADRKGVARPGRVLSKSLKAEYQRVKNRSPGVICRAPGERSPETLTP
jgi:hypothetical protein